MPELKRTFTGGKMNKDLDERIVPSGEYREALNIGVATSEDSDVGAAQNILGNTRVTSAISSRSYSPTNPNNNGFGNQHAVWDPQSRTGANSHIAEIVDPETDMLYRFVHTTNSWEGLWMDRIVEYDTNSNIGDAPEGVESAVMIDIFKVEARIVGWESGCIGNNKCRIKVNKNLNQLRWGMTIVDPTFNPVTSPAPHSIPPGVTIELIEYDQTGQNNGWITLSEPIWCNTTVPFPDPPNCIGYAPGLGPSGNTFGAAEYTANGGSGIDYTFIGDRNLNFSPYRKITGINIIDGMIFWTDNYSEPKKVNIKRGKLGSDSTHPIAVGIGDGGTSRGRQWIDSFNQHTLLVVNDDIVEDCLKDESSCPPLGCTDPLACNYNPLALYEDPSVIDDPSDDNYGELMNPCCFVEGCMDPTACNYDPLACCDDGSCCPAACGCGDPAYCEYDPTACHDQTYCLTLVGCTDPTANNYDQNAGCSGPCYYNYSCVDQGYGGTNECSSMLSVAEMTYANAKTYIHDDSQQKAIQGDPADSTTWTTQLTGNGNQDANSWIAPDWSTNNQVDLYYPYHGQYMTGEYIMPDVGPYENMGTNTAKPLNVKIAAPIWMYQQNPTDEIGDYSNWMEYPNLTFNDDWTDPVLGGDICVYPINPDCTMDPVTGSPSAECSDGSKWKNRLSAVIIPNMWRYLDGKCWEDWNTTTKSGAQAQGTSVNTSALPAGWLPGIGPGGGNWEYISGEEYAEYLINPNIALHGIDLDDLWSFGACFGADCERLVDKGFWDWIGNNPGGVPSAVDLDSLYWGGDKINPATGVRYGDTWEGIINFLRDNGFGGGDNVVGNGNTPPSIHKQVGPTNAQYGPVLQPSFHGLREYLGTTTVEDFINNNVLPNGTTHPDQGGYTTGNPSMMSSTSGTYFIKDPVTGVDTVYPKDNHSKWPEVTISDTVEEVISKVINNGIGWHMNNLDVPIPRDWVWITRLCACSGQFAYTPTCVIDPNGSFASLNDCENCASCDCNPQATPPTPISGI